MRVVCVTCQTELQPKQNGVAVVEMAAFGPYRLWRADLLACPGCGFEIVTQFAMRHVAHYEPDFARQLDLAKATASQVIYDYERAQTAEVNP